MPMLTFEFTVTDITNGQVVLVEYHAFEDHFSANSWGLRETKGMKEHNLKLTWRKLPMQVLAN